MIMKERLLNQMGNLVVETKWEDVLTETINQLFQVKPSNPYQYLQRKMSLKQKMDNTKTSQYLLELTLYLTHLDPSITPENIVKDKIVCLCVQKYQHTKIKKSQINQIINVILLQFEGLRRDYFIKVVGQMVDHQICSIIQYSQVLYYAVIYRAVLEQLQKLERKLDKIKITLDKHLLLQYINTTNEKNSLLKSLNLELEGQEGVIKMIATEIALKINI